MRVLVALLALIGLAHASSCKNSLYVRWPGVRLNFRAVASGKLSLKACQSACSLGEDPVMAGKSLECAALNHQTSVDNFNHHCDVFQPHQLQNVDGFVEADDRYSFYWRYCVDSHKQCGNDHAFTFMSDRYMEATEVIEVRHTSSLEDCLAECLNEEKFPCRSLSFNRTDGGCHMSANNQLTKPKAIRLNNNPNYRIDYYENNCYNLTDSYKFEYKCQDDGVLVTIDSKFPYTGALYGLYDFFTCRIEPKEQTRFEYFFPSPTKSKRCSDSIRYKGNDMVLDVVLSTDGVEPLYFITPDDMTFQAKCPIAPLTSTPARSLNHYPEVPPSTNDITADQFAASAHALFSELGRESVRESIPMIINTTTTSTSTSSPRNPGAKTFEPSRTPLPTLIKQAGSSSTVTRTTPRPTTTKDTYKLPLLIEDNTPQVFTKGTTTTARSPSTGSTTRVYATTTTARPTVTQPSTTKVYTTTTTTARPTVTTTRSSSTSRSTTTTTTTLSTTTSTSTPRPTTTTTTSTSTTTTTTARPTTQPSTATTTTSTSKTTITTKKSTAEVNWNDNVHLARAPAKPFEPHTAPTTTTTTTAGPPGTEQHGAKPRQPVTFDIFHNGRPVEAVVVGNRIILDFTPHFPIPPRYMSVRGCQVEPIDPRYDWEKEPLPIIRDGCPSDLVGLACPPASTDHGMMVSIEAFRYQTTAHVQYTCLVRVCPFAECPQTECPHVDGCDVGPFSKGRAKRGLTLDDIRRALEADPNLQRQIGLSSMLGRTPAINTEQQLLALAGDHVVKRRLVVVNSEDQLRYYVRTGQMP